MSDLAAVAAAAGAGFAVAKPVAEAASDLAQKLLGQPFKVAGDLLADQVYCWQCVNRIRLLEKLKLKIDESKVQVKSLPPGFLIPAIDAVGNVDDECLQDFWARLLCSAIQDDAAASPSFIETLRRLGPAEAKWLNENAKKVPTPYVRNYSIVPSSVNGYFAAPPGIGSKLVALGLLQHPLPTIMVKRKQPKPDPFGWGTSSETDLGYTVELDPENPSYHHELTHYGVELLKALELR